MEDLRLIALRLRQLATEFRSYEKFDAYLCKMAILGCVQQMNRELPENEQTENAKAICAA
jgi:hypothetical protein